MPALVLVAWIYVLSLPWLPLFAAGQDSCPSPRPAARGGLSPTSWSSRPSSPTPELLRAREGSASTTAFFIFAQPIITAVAAYLLLGERLTPALGLAALGLFSGMALVARRPR